MLRTDVCIAVPTWNHEFFLPRAVRSGLDAVARVREAGGTGEVLIVDDASRDGTEALLRSLEALYGGQGLRVARHETNQGLAAARNTAIREARSRYITFMDADNHLVPDNFPTFLRAIRETGAAAVYGNLLMRRLGEETAFWACSNESFQPRIHEENYIDAFALFDREQLIDCGGYHLGCDAWADWEMWLHLAASGRRLVFVPLVFGVYQHLTNSMMRVAAAGETPHARFRRMFDQLGFRSHAPARTHHERYFPGLGYL